jgi:hypothetical protein
MSVESHEATVIGWVRRRRNGTPSCHDVLPNLPGGRNRVLRLEQLEAHSGRQAVPSVGRHRQSQGVAVSTYLDGDIPFVAQQRRRRRIGVMALWKVDEEGGRNGSFDDVDVVKVR